jgi:hypothetical protein
MDARELHRLYYDDEGQPRLYSFKPRQKQQALDWSDGDICVCGIHCAKHWNADGDWIGCKGAREIQ